MADKAIEKGRTERYLPKAAWAKLSKEERKETDEKKKEASKKSQKVRNITYIKSTLIIKNNCDRTSLHQTFKLTLNGKQRRRQKQELRDGTGQS